MGSVVRLVLISHTNVGKTTLARTLLGADIGEARDEAHVTLDVTAYPMIDTPEGDRLELWDTPGLGDSVRLARRLSAQSDPIGWFVSHVWDRFRDRPLWLAQKAIRSVRDNADVVLYLVNAAEEPADAAYLEPELALLEWIGKPVVVLLNQTGPPRPPDLESAEQARWTASLASHAPVRTVLPLDAFARCWVQELTLLHAIADVLAGERRAAFERLGAQWQARREQQFEASMNVTAQLVAQAARDRAEVANSTMAGALELVGNALGLRRASPAAAQAMDAMATRLDAAIATSMDALIGIHGLEGHAARAVMQRMAAHVTARTPVSEGKAALVGGVVSGALSGLVADLASGGLTLGLGMIAGGLVGMLGGAGVARGYNVARGTRVTELRWTDEFLDGLVAGALLRYLAVAHYGRGRGAWIESEYPPFWRERVLHALGLHRRDWSALWQARGTSDQDRYARDIAAALRAVTVDLLHDLYPAAPPG